MTPVRSTTAILRDAGTLQHLGDRDARCARSGDDDLDVLEIAVGDPQRVDQRGQDNDGRAVLVVVEHRDVEQIDQPALDLEAARARDVLEVDATERRGQPDDRLDDLLGVGRGQRDRDRVDATELLEQHRLALHDGHRRGRADVTEPQHSRAVGDRRRRCWRPRCIRGRPRDRPRWPRTLGRRPACRRSRDPAASRSGTVVAIAILPPRCSAKTGSSGSGVSVCMSMSVTTMG